MSTTLSKTSCAAAILIAAAFGSAACSAPSRSPEPAIALPAPVHASVVTPGEDSVARGPVRTPLTTTRTAPVAQLPTPPANVPASLPAAIPTKSIAAKNSNELTRAPIDVAAKFVGGAPPVYPSESRRNGEEGSVKLRIRVGADGAVGVVDVLASSGFERLDKAAVTAVGAWKFAAATRDGVGMASLVVHTVTFQLEPPRD
jgi:protein TonB